MITSVAGIFPLESNGYIDSSCRDIYEKLCDASEPLSVIAIANFLVKYYLTYNVNHLAWAKMTFEQARKFFEGIQANVKVLRDFTHIIDEAEDEEARWLAINRKTEYCRSLEWEFGQDFSNIIYQLAMLGDIAATTDIFMDIANRKLRKTNLPLHIDQWTGTGILLLAMNVAAKRNNLKNNRYFWIDRSVVVQRRTQIALSQLLESEFNIISWDTCSHETYTQMPSDGEISQVTNENLPTTKETMAAEPWFKNNKMLRKILQDRGQNVWSVECFPRGVVFSGTNNLSGTFNFDQTDYFQWWGSLTWLERMHWQWISFERNMNPVGIDIKNKIVPLSEVWSHAISHGVKRPKVVNLVRW